MALNITLHAGDNLYKYQLVRKIGGGHFGEVWLAHDVTISKDVAVKILDESMAPVAENLKEAQVGHKLDHQNVVKVHYADVVSVNGNNIVLIAMDFHPNGSIVGQLNPGNFMSVINAINITTDILRGLEYLHEQGLFHNDIKPSNILIGPRSEGILTDYGISCVSPGLQPAQAPNAYVLHRAPETTIDSNISVQTDVYQVGLTLFRIINGIGLIRDLRDSLGQARFDELKAQDKIPRSTDYQPFVSRSIKRIITKAIKTNPDDRYQSALEMRRALEGIRLYGYWVIDSTGRYIGYFNDQIFTYDIQKTLAGYNFIAHRKRLSSGKTTNIARFSAKKITKKEYLSSTQKFMAAVIEGSI